MAYLKQMISATLVLLAAAGGYAAYDRLAANRPHPGDRDELARSAPAVSVEVSQVERRQITEEVEAVGTSLALQSVEIVALASGRVQEILFEPGQRISAGDVLVRLDDDIERADVAQAEAALNESELNLQRARTLIEKNAVSQASVDQAVTHKATAEANLDRARRRLADRTVRAPFDGIVGMRRIDIGARVDDSTVLTTLDDLSQIRIEFSVSETLYGRLKPDQPVSAVTAAYPGRRFVGKVDSIDTRVDPRGRAFKVRANIPNEDLALPAGMFMHVTIELGTRDAVMVPETAIVPQGGRSYVFLVNDGKAERREVALGVRQPGSVEIAEGIEAGDLVVVSGAQRLRNGSPVQVVTASRSAG